MATAAVISREETRQACAKTRARQARQAYLERGLERVEAHRPDDTPRLEALTPAVLALRQALTGQITAVLVAPPHAQGLNQCSMACPPCQRLLPARPAPPRTGHPRVGEVSRSRPYWYCPEGPPGFAPVDEALQLSERRTPWEMPPAAARRAAAGPFETAQARFTQLPGRSLSDQTIQAVTGELSQELGVLEVSPTAAAMAQRVAERAAGKTWRPLRVLAMAGACVPTRPAPATGATTGRRRTPARRAGWQGAWQEATGVRCYRVDQERMVHGLRWSQVARDEDVGTALRRGQDAGWRPEAQVRWGGLGAGAPWSWQPVNALLPTAVPILDDDHGREHVHTGGGLPCGEAAVPARAWVEAMMARLCWGDGDWAIAGLETLHPRDDPTAEAIRQLLGCLRNHAGRLHDRTARTGGYPLGRGGIEAANKRSSQVRLKRSGAWWYIEQANDM